VWMNYPKKWTKKPFFRKNPIKFYPKTTIFLLVPNFHWQRL
jgi:hypothetical protein